MSINYFSYQQRISARIINEYYLFYLHYLSIKRLQPINLRIYANSCHFNGVFCPYTYMGYYYPL